jgi:hypothetical protein
MRAPLAIALSLTLFATRPCHADARECIAEHEAGIAAKEAKKPLEARPKFAACTRPECPAAVREECAAMVEQLDRQIPSVVIAVKDPDQRDLVDVRLFIDGKLVSEKLSGQAIELEPGQHEFRIRHSKSGELVQRALIVEGEQRRRIAFTFQPRARKTEKPAPVAPKESSHSIPTVSWVLGGVGLIALGSFGYFAASGKSKEKDLESCSPGCDPKDVDVMRKRYLIADISLGVSVVAFGGALGFALVPSSDGKSAALRLNGSF